MLNVLIVDDEPSARDNLRHLLEAEEGISIVGECANAIEAISGIHRLQPDVVFLDIQMPRITGLEMVGMLDPNRMPHIVFLTAYDEYAVQAFEEHAFDYLLKPAEPKRLSKTLQRLQQQRGQQNIAALDESAGYLKYIPCTGHSRIYLLRFDEVVAIRSRLSGVFVVRNDGMECFTELTLRTLEMRTPLVRCHRQYLVNLEQVREIRFDDNGAAEMIMPVGEPVPVSRRYLKALKEELGLRG
ncbi:two-component system response regulator BtsR [Serratia quinivorans]|jgi:two-component system LytT family response regulator|uniref:Two-component system response regulator BtsR n=2 Tax=Serratia TaxID=613 RepID=A0ABV3UNA5_9GAMM|nr:MULTISPECIES: two-component system response regulator BtsR [Serratia]MDW5506799.1 two-component system response regulator BtsR [Pseudomonas lundensis]MCS4268535.1 two-component system LytT family response regulator [Serratia sp. BIGb0163]MDW5501736.1 two-component system response regulator BtsR [Serratia proteamaculans]CAI1203255.1 Probable transcriptional regulatory protein YehT [Serratia quinivorans]CAI1721008.1 Probable transcriptional regulatory protein YehT [Serratia quinivorans]